VSKVRVEVDAVRVEVDAVRVEVDDVRVEVDGAGILYRFRAGLAGDDDSSTPRPARAPTYSASITT
jgi:hypothetical protein